MRRTILRGFLLAVLGVSSLVANTGYGQQQQAQQPAARPARADRAKTAVIEAPAAALLRNSSPAGGNGTVAAQPPAAAPANPPAPAKPAPANPAAPAKSPPLDVTKVRVVERPAKELVGKPPKNGANANPAPRNTAPVDEATARALVANREALARAAAKDPQLDLAKGDVVERPAKALLRNLPPGANAPEATTNASVTPENPKVKAGDVYWHGSFAEAREAAAISNKPVLLFHMMGKLDQEFC